MDSQPLIQRYQDAYRVGRAVNALGSSVKFLGFVIALVMGLLWWVSVSSGGEPRGGNVTVAQVLLLFGGLISALAVFIVFWLVGTLLCALAQVLIASLDTAVNGSPFLADDQRLSAMSLDHLKSALSSASNDAAPPTVPVQSSAGVGLGDVSIAPRASESAGQAARAFCPACSAPIANPGSRFCVQCGQAL